MKKFTTLISTITIIFLTLASLVSSCVNKNQSERIQKLEYRIEVLKTKIDNNQGVR